MRWGHHTSLVKKERYEAKGINNQMRGGGTLQCEGSQQT